MECAVVELIYKFVESLPLLFEKVSQPSEEPFNFFGMHTHARMHMRTHARTCTHTGQ